MKTKKSIQIKSVPYFPKTVRAIGAIFCLFGLAMLWTLPVIGLLFIFITTVLYTTHYGFEISTGPNSFREYVWILGFKEGKRTPFKAIEFLFIQPGTFTFLTYVLREKSLPAFEAYIKFEGRNEVHFITDTNKDKLINRMEPSAKFLNVPILDYTEGNPATVFEP